MLTWPKFLKYSQGIMFFESLAFDKVPAPAFADQMGIQKYQMSIQQKLRGIWDMMFPHTQGYYDEVIEGAMRFKEHMRRWRKER